VLALPKTTVEPEGDHDGQSASDEESVIAIGVAGTEVMSAI